MALKIGQRVGDKIYAGSHYGLQSPASYNKLKKQGAFKRGAKEIRSGKQLIRGIVDRLPQSVKDAGSRISDFYAGSAERERQRFKDRGFTDQQIDEANRIIERVSKNGDATERFIQTASDKTNIAPEIIQAAAVLAEVGAEGLAGRALARRTLAGAARGRKVDGVAQAMGKEPKVNRFNQNKPERPLQQPTPRLAEGQFPGGSEAALVRDTKVRSGISQKARDIKAGKAKPAQSSVNKASDQGAIAKAEAASKNSTTSNRTNEDVIVPTVSGDKTDFRRYDPKTDELRSSKPQQRRHSTTGKSEKVSDLDRQPPSKQSPSYKPTPRIRNQAIKAKVDELKAQRRRAQQDNVDRVFSGGEEIDLGGGPLSSLPAKRGTASTFPSKKGADVRTRGSRIEPDDVNDYTSDVDGLYEYGDGSIGKDTEGFSVVSGERTGRGAGKPGQARALNNSIQQQRFSEILGVDLSRMNRKERRAAILGHLSDNGVNTRSMKPSEQNRAISTWIEKNSLSDQAVRDRASKQLSERRFPEQFNQLEARDRQGVELPARARNSADRRGRKTRPHGSRANPGSKSSKGQEVVNPDREYVIGKGSKPREGNKTPKNMSVRERIQARTQTNETSRSDNIPGGRRIKQSRPEYKSRIEQARARARARAMSGKPEDVLGAGQQDKPNFRKPTQAERAAIKQEDKNRSAIRTIEGKIKSRQSFDDAADAPLPSTTKERIRGPQSPKGRNRGNPLLDAERAEDTKQSKARDPRNKPKGDIRSGEGRDGRTVAQPQGPKRSSSSRPSITQRVRRSAEERRLARESVQNPSKFEQERDQFIRENVPQERYVSPQDGKRNPNPFNSEGDLRGSKVKGGKPKGRSTKQSKRAKRLIEKIRKMRK